MEDLCTNFEATKLSYKYEFFIDFYETLWTNV